MKLFPAIDLYDGCAVRLFKGDYRQMTVYSRDPSAVAQKMQNEGARFLHMVDLQGARDGTTPNLETVLKVRGSTNLYMEIGGGIRSLDTVETYLSAGVNRVILGTAAVTDETFLTAAIRDYGERIAVGVDMKDGFVAIRGWTEQSAYSGIEFCHRMQEKGVKAIICTDISRDGAMRGTNRNLYRELSGIPGMDIIASGGVSTLEDVRVLRDMGLSGAILGKAYYTGAVLLSEALEVAR